MAGSDRAGSVVSGVVSGVVAVGVDFSAGSGAALRQGARIAAWSGGKLHAISVSEPPMAYLPDPTFFPEAMLGFDQDLLSEAQEQWKRFGPEHGASGVPLQGVIGTPASELLRVSRGAGATMLVLGSNSSSGTGAGPVASACVRHAECPVLLVRPEQVGRFARVLACVDFSAGSLRALEWACRCAAQDQAALHVLHVFRAPWRGRTLKPGDPLGAAEFQERYREALAAHMEKFAEPMHHELAYLKPKFDALEDDRPGPAIARWAAWINADLVVLGTRGRTNLRDMLIGSTAERVLRETRSAVLAVPPEKAGKAEK